LNFAGTADEVLALGRAGLIELCISRAILDETEGVLIRKFRWSTPRAREAMQAIRAFTVLVHRILECARAAGAEAIVTGDHHLPQLRRFRGIQITRPRDFLDAQTRR